MVSFHGYVYFQVNEHDLMDRTLLEGTGSCNLNDFYVIIRGNGKWYVFFWWQGKLVCFFWFGTVARNIGMVILGSEFRKLNGKHVIFWGCLHSKLVARNFGMVVNSNLRFIGLYNVNRLCHSQ